MNDPDYFRDCMARASEASRRLLEPLPEICDRALEQATDYGDWQARTRYALGSDP